MNWNFVSKIKQKAKYFPENEISTTSTPLQCNSTLEWIGDGFCDDATNNQGKKRLAQKTCNHLF